MISNHWLKIIKNKALFSAIELAFMETWADNGNLNDVFAKLSVDQCNFLLEMPIKDFASDPDDLTLTFELYKE